MLRDNTSARMKMSASQVSNAAGANRAPTQRTTESLKHQFTRDYEFPPTASQVRELDLPDRVLLTVIQFLGMKNLVRCKKLSRHWLCRIQQLFDNISRPLQDKFINSGYADYFEICNAKLVVGPTEFGRQRGLRIDRIIEMRLKEDSADVRRHAGKTFKIECAYRYREEDMNGNPAGRAGSGDDAQADGRPKDSVVFRP